MDNKQVGESVHTRVMRVNICFARSTAPHQMFGTVPTITQVYRISSSVDQPSCFSDPCHVRQAAAAHAQASGYTMGPATFYDLFPYHLILDAGCRVVQAR